MVVDKIWIIPALILLIGGIVLWNKVPKWQSMSMVLSGLGIFVGMAFLLLLPS